MPKYKEFERDYEQNALLQKGFNRVLIEDFIAYIQRIYPEAQKHPIKILDLCCGDGGMTAIAFEKLQQRGILIDRFVGYDISSEQISIAHKKYGTLDERLSFKCQDATKITDVNEYDVVISLFGLHWIESLKPLAELISKALKPRGKLFYFVPLEKNDFFKMREKLVKSEKWSDYFFDFSIKAFIDSSQSYMEAFKEYFQMENKDGVEGQQDINYCEEDFLRFISSWMPELRELSPELKKEYLQDLLKQIPSPVNDCQNVTKKDSAINFRERFFWFHGTKCVDEKTGFLDCHSVSYRS